MTSSPPPQPTRTIRSYVLRAGRIGPGQQRALAELGPRFVLPFQTTPLDFAAVFGRDAPTVAGIHVFFPDPWHKKKHHKRRLVQPAFVRQLVTRLAPGGSLHCATDWQPYAEQMLEVLSAEPALVNTASGYAPKPDYRPLTKFESRGLKLGHGVWDLVFERR
jgi:tRNA (guanine-N7-)-methyltransferase